MPGAADLLLGVMRASAAEVRARMRHGMVVARAALGMAQVPGASRRAALATGGAARLLRAAAHVGAPVAARRSCGREPGAARRTHPALARRTDPDGTRAPDLAGCPVRRRRPRRSARCPRCRGST